MDVTDELILNESNTLTADCANLLNEVAESIHLELLEKYKNR